MLDFKYKYNLVGNDFLKKIITQLYNLVIVEIYH